MRPSAGAYGYNGHGKNMVIVTQNIAPQGKWILLYYCNIRSYNILVKGNTRWGSG
jgi:hypothetical protein